MREADLNDEDDDDLLVAPSVVATDERDLAACAPYTPRAVIARDGSLVEVGSGRPIAVRDIADDLSSLLVFARDASATQRAALNVLAAAVRENGATAIVVVRQQPTPVGRLTPVATTLEVEVAAAAWDDLAPLAALVLDGVDLAAPRRSHRGASRGRFTSAPLRLRWLHVDARPAPMIAALRRALGGRRVFAGARVPERARDWHADGDVELWSAADFIEPSGDGSCAEVLVIEEAPNAGAVLVGPEIIAPDPRPFRGELAFVDDIETCARRIASLHLTHGNALLTERLVGACANHQSDDVNVVRMLAHLVNGYLGAVIVNLDARGSHVPITDPHLLYSENRRLLRSPKADR